MNEREKVIIYPFDIEFCPIVRHKEFLGKYDIVSVVSPNGWGLTDEDVGHIDGGKLVGIKVSNNFEQEIKLCDTVIISDSYNKIDFDKIIYPKIVKAAESGKNVVCTINLDDKNLKLVKDLCEKKGVYFKYYPKATNIKSNNYIGKLARIETPIVFVAGMGEKTNKFEIQLSLRRHLNKMGYKVSSIGTRNYCELLGFHSFPRFMQSLLISESDKVILFNKFIKNIEYKENPDVIVIGMPGGIMKFNNLFNNGFGILAYQISQAVKPDAVVFSMLYEDYLPKYFDMISTKIKYRFGFEIDCFNMSNTKFNWAESKSFEVKNYITVNSTLVNEKVKKLNYSLQKPMYNILNSNDDSNITSYLVDCLSEENIDVI